MKMRQLKTRTWRRQRRGMILRTLDRLWTQTLKVDLSPFYDLLDTRPNGQPLDTEE
jgi:hypothetical protein